MLLLESILKNAFNEALYNLGYGKDIKLILLESTRDEFGDYQLNNIMSLAKLNKTNPIELANLVKVNSLPLLKDVVEKIDIAGPGFLNIFISNNFLSQYICGLHKNNKYGVTFLNHTPETVVVDLSSPNLAKEMHVGHLRSTVIGDSLARIIEYLGDKVIRQNHVGDWGTQFGMLITYLQEEQILLEPKLETIYKINELESLYQKAKLKFDQDSEFADRSRYAVTLLQMLDKNSLKYWKLFRDESLKHCKEVYDKLNLKEDLTGTNIVRGESFYEKFLPEVINDLEQQNIIVISEGAKCVFFKSDQIVTAETSPFIVQKKDGGYLYSTSDLAAIKYRVKNLHASRLIYVVDKRQSLHFNQLFEVSRMVKYTDNNVKLEHSYFGTMMNASGSPFKTRSGGTVKLIDLINEAIKRSYELVVNRNSDWSESAKLSLAETIAIDSIKYSDLSKNRISDYIFSFDKMLKFDGNTALYMLYAYTRINSILKKVTLNLNSKIIIETNIEHKLILHLTKFPYVVKSAAEECFPHYICQYVYDLACLFMKFYEQCPIIKNSDIRLKESRLYISNRTAEIIYVCLNDLLGIKIVYEM